MRGDGQYYLTMNAIFTAIFVSSAIMLCITDANAFLPALLGGAEKALTSFAALCCIYMAWMGLSRVAEDAGITRAAAKKLQPLCGRLFRTKNQSGCEYAAMNLTCNMLGLGGAATPYGIKAMREFSGEGNIFGRNMMFILNAASVQIIPSTVIALRASYESSAPADIFLPALITTVVCTGAACALLFATDKLSCLLSSRRSS